MVSTVPTTRAKGGPYPPISTYALIGDCHSSALISEVASIDSWWRGRWYPPGHEWQIGG